MKRLLALLLTLWLLILPTLAEVLVDDGVAITEELMVEYGYSFAQRDEVALYLHAFCELPPNYITKAEARELGWMSVSYDLWEVAPGMSIGGDRFGNREGLLPDSWEREWYECDLNYCGGKRGAERLVFSNDGLIYFTSDHYASFTQLYDAWYED